MKDYKDMLEELLNDISHKLKDINNRAYLAGYNQGIQDGNINDGTFAKEGHWIIHPKGIYAHLICDKCLSNAPYDCRTNYCPNCGAKMVEPQESEG